MNERERLKEPKESDKPSLSTIIVTDEMLDIARDIIEEYFIGEGQYLMPREMFKRVFLAMLEAVPR